MGGPDPDPESPVASPSAVLAFPMTCLDGEMHFLLMPAATIYRCMRPDPDGLPRLGASLSTLGVRPGKDIPVLPDGSVAPKTGGMSVTPENPT